MLVDQGTTGHLGGVSGQHQIDVQLAHGLDDGLLGQVEAFSLSNICSSGSGPDLLFAATGDGVELLRHVRQVEELAECTGHGQQFVIGEGTVRGVEQASVVPLFPLREDLASWRMVSILSRKACHPDDP